MRSTILTFSLAVGILAGGPARADMFTPSKSDQVKLGTRASAEIRKKEKVLSDSDRRVRMMREIAGKLLSSNPDGKKDPWQYSFDVIDNKQVNAFALPGGPIYFYTGLIDKFQTEDQFAAVLAHELVHIRKEHWARAYGNQQKRALGFTVILMLLNANRTITDLASISNDLLISLPFARRDETQSDDIGYDMMIKAGYNPQGMVEVFQILRDSTKGGKPPEFISTHPDDKNRIQRIADKIKKSNKDFGPQRRLPWKSEDSSASFGDLLNELGMVRVEGPRPCCA